MGSGASNHVTIDAHNLTTKTNYKGKDKFVVGNGSKLLISHIGSSVIASHNLQKPLYLNNILHVPSITKNLLSISQFTHDNNVIIEFYSNCCLVKDKNSKAILIRTPPRTDETWNQDKSQRPLDLVLGGNHDPLLITKQKPQYNEDTTINYGLLIDKSKGECHEKFDKFEVLQELKGIWVTFSKV